MGELIIYGNKAMVLSGESVEGVRRYCWTEDNQEEIAEAQKAFDEYVSRGWFALGEKKDKKKNIFRFDPTLDKITLGPIAVGG